MKKRIVPILACLCALAAIAATPWWTSNAPSTRAVSSSQGYGQLTIRASIITSTNGYYLPTNALSAWPTVPRSSGEAFIANSNGVIYILTSVPGGTNWASTNKLAP